MNSCILMAEIVGEPELRSTQEGMAVSNVLIEFPGIREEDPTAKIKLVGWGNLAEEMKNNYHNGDRVIIEGRLSMNIIEIDGYKEKKAELVASRIYPLGSAGNFNTTSSTNEARFEPASTPQPAPSNSQPSREDFASTPEPAYSQPVATEPMTTDAADGNWDEIPFVRPVYSRTNFGSQLCDSWELEANRYWDGLKQFV